MKKIFLLLLMGLLCFISTQCSNDDATTPTCQLLKWNPSLRGTDTIYQGEYTYENNRVVSKKEMVRYLGTSYYIPVVYTANYDADGKVISVDAQYEKDEFQYLNGLSQPSLRIHYRKQNGTPFLDYTEQISYDSSGRILKAVQNTHNEISQVYVTNTFTYEYKANNLYRYAEIYHMVTPNYTSHYGKVTYIDGYDNMKNPFKNFKSPFVNERVYQFSENNWTDIHYASIDSEDVESPTGSYSSRGLNYNERGYPAGNVYNCN